MRKFFVLLSVWMFCLSAIAEDIRTSTLRQSGLLIPNAMGNSLRQKNFDSGSVRITQPGYYYLKEDIIFDPISSQEALRTDKPETGAWFTAISIECDNVIIDMNTKKISVSQNFLENHELKLFSLISFNNSLTEDLSFSYAGETELISATAVTVKNGVLAQSPYYGIHGITNNKIQLYDMIIKDFEAAAIYLPLVQAVIINNITIRGTDHVVPFTLKRALMRATAVTLQQLFDGGDLAVQPHLDSVNVLLADNAQNGTDDSTGEYDANSYGIYLTPTVTQEKLLVMCDNPEIVSVTAIEDSVILDVHAHVKETVAIGDNTGEPLKGPLFGILRWEDVYPSGTFEPNDLLKAQVYAVDATDPGAYPVGFADNILAVTPNEATFLSQVQPVFNHDIAGNNTVGVFGMRIDCARGLALRNIRIINMKNTGDIGLTLGDIPSGGSYGFSEERYTGNDSYGISFSSSENCAVDNCRIVNCISNNGDASGIAIGYESRVYRITNCFSVNHKAFGNLVGSVVNPPSCVYGYRVYNGPQAIRFNNCISQSLISARYAYGFYTNQTKDIVIQACESSSHIVNDANNLASKKEVFSFYSVNTDTTYFDNCFSSSNSALGEDLVMNSGSCVGGFALNNEDMAKQEHCSTIINSKSVSHNAGKGKAFGIYLNGADETTVKKNITTNNIGEEGYGIYKTDSDDKVLVLGNISYGNTTSNYQVNGTTWPILSLTSDNISNPNIVNPLFNLEFSLVTPVI